MDKFPEAFERFERVVDTRQIWSFRQLVLAFRLWAGEKWRGTQGQMTALKVEALKKGIPVPKIGRWTTPPMRTIRIPTWRHETIIVRGKLQDRYRDLRTGRFVKKPSGYLGNR